MNSLQLEIEAKGREIFEWIRDETPSVFSRRNVTGRLMEWSMRDEHLKTQLFRLVDVLPALRSSGDVARHAQEYLMGTATAADGTERAGDQDGDGRATALSGVMRLAMRIAPKVPWLTRLAAQRGVEQMARTFILARNGADAGPKLRAMRKAPLAFTVDILGETVVSETEAAQYQSRYLELINSLSDAAEHWPVIDQIDRDGRGLMPRVNVSVKISALDPLILSTDPEGALDRLCRRLKPILVRARDRGALINFDMEQTALKDLTLALFKRLLDDPELADVRNVGIAIQAYLHDTERDLIGLIEWAKARDRRITIRLIKGAYWDYETILAQQRGWPSPVFQEKAETDANYERLAALMLDHDRWVDCAFGTHNIRSIAACLVMAERRGLSRRHFEIQMLYGMAEPIKTALVQMGHRVRDYCPIGEVLPGMSYLVRRLLENTSNEGFLRATFGEHTAPEELLRDPAAIMATRAETETPAEQGNETALGEEKEVVARQRSVASLPNSAGGQVAGLEFRFANEPHTDFTKASNRERMRQALVQVRAELGGFYPLVIGGQEITTDAVVDSVNPARPSELVGRVAQAGRQEADRAIAAASAAHKGWRASSAAERARLLERTAELIREERFRIAALEVFETGKTWIESDADVAEAIDFCRFYAAEMRRIAETSTGVPGELSVHRYRPRGIALVIAPWNFPLAILCGMTTAALVTGNCAIMKPSDQSPVIAAWFMNLLRRAGFPPGVVNFVPGRGSEIGAYLVEHPAVDLIAFTGSREVGLKIYEAAGRTHPEQQQLKKVICEMGGKNAVIVDADADLDEAIPAIVAAAFGYQGQKCSALSRLIVLKENYARVVERLIEATRLLPIGLPEEPGTLLGPIIDKESQERILAYIEIGKREATLALQVQALAPNKSGGLNSGPEIPGYFVGPAIFVDVPPEARIAQEEIFGPVLCVLRANDLDQAIRWANSTRYALTGGLFSRSPGNIERVKQGFEVGNLYINRGITGALVGRHPFGGYKMSGVGTKAGGTEYLQHFMLPYTITENQMRRGFAPMSSPARNNEFYGARPGI